MATSSRTRSNLIQCFLALSGPFYVGTYEAKDLETDEFVEVSLLQRTVDHVNIDLSRNSKISPFTAPKAGLPPGINWCMIYDTLIRSPQVPWYKVPFAVPYLNKYSEQSCVSRGGASWPKHSLSMTIPDAKNDLFRKMRIQTYMCCCVACASLGLAIMTRLLWKQGVSDMSDGRPSEKTVTRSSLLDNAKAFAMWVVLVQHILNWVVVTPPEWPCGPSGCWMYFKEKNIWRVGHDVENVLVALRTLSMPMFSLVSGICSQGSPTMSRFRSIVTQLMLPLIIWLWLFQPYIADPFTKLAVEKNICDTFLWFLVALILWRVLAFTCWQHLTSSQVLLSSVVISCVGGYIDPAVAGSNFTKSVMEGLRHMIVVPTLGFLPHFAIGYVLPFDTIMSKFSGVSVTVRCAAACFVSMWIVVRIVVFPTRLPYGQNLYEDMFISEYPNFDFYLYWTQRVTIITLETVASLVVLIFLMPREENPLTTWVGHHTIYAYMFNKCGICAYSLLLGALQGHAAFPIWESYAALTAVVFLQGLAAFLILLLLTSWPWRWLFKMIVEPECVYSFVCSLGGAALSVTRPPEPVKTTTLPLPSSGTTTRPEASS